MDWFNRSRRLVRLFVWFIFVILCGDDGFVVLTCLGLCLLVLWVWLFYLGLLTALLGMFA